MIWFYYRLLPTMVRITSHPLLSEVQSVTCSTHCMSLATLPYSSSDSELKYRAPRFGFGFTLPLCNLLKLRLSFYFCIASCIVSLASVKLSLSVRKFRLALPRILERPSPWHFTAYQRRALLTALLLDWSNDQTLPLTFHGDSWTNIS